MRLPYLLHLDFLLACLPIEDLFFFFIFFLSQLILQLWQLHHVLRVLVHIW